jgi:hypothetical protein
MNSILSEKMFRPLNPTSEWIERVAESTFRGLGVNAADSQGLSPADYSKLLVLFKSLAIVDRAATDDMAKSLRIVIAQLENELAYAEEVYADEPQGVDVQAEDIRCLGMTELTKQKR